MRRLNHILRLLLLCLLAGTFLAWFSAFIQPRLESGRKERLTVRMREILPGALDFREDKKGVVTGYDSGGKAVGRIGRGSQYGFHSDITVLVGAGENGIVTGVAVEGEQETPGSGNKIREERFLDQFAGRKKNELALPEDDGKIHAVSGATVSSRACVKAVRKGLDSLKARAYEVPPSSGSAFTVNKSTAAWRRRVKKSTAAATADEIRDSRSKETDPVQGPINNGQ